VPSLLSSTLVYTHTHTHTHTSHSDVYIPLDDVSLATVCHTHSDLISVWVAAGQPVSDVDSETAAGESSRVIFWARVCNKRERGEGGGLTEQKGRRGEPQD